MNPAPDASPSRGGSPAKPAPVLPPYPTGRLLGTIGLSALALVGLWTAVLFVGDLDIQVYRGGVIGLIAATAAHLGGTMVGAALAPAKGSMAAYLASTVVRFMLTPALAVSLYFLLPVKPQPVLVGAAAGYLLILVADIGTMLKAMQQRSGSASA
ncbi:MAG: hypothetical protein ACOYMM_13135 [Phycisphaerales bacterium]